MLLSTATESVLPKGSWVLAGFAVNPKKCEVLPYVWNMLKPESQPVQMSVITKNNKQQLCNMASFLKHTNATMWTKDTDQKCETKQQILLRDRVMQLFSPSNDTTQKKDATASKVTKRSVQKKKRDKEHVEEELSGESSEDEEPLAARRQRQAPKVAKVSNRGAEHGY